MLRDIIRKEILDNITGPKFVFAFVLCTILILLSTYTGISNYVAEKKEYDANVALNRKILQRKTDYLGVRGAVTIYKPPQALGTVVTGIEEAVGHAAPAGGIDRSDLLESKYEGNPVFAVFGALDLMFIVKIVLSLVAILFTYDSIVGEKEKGTLKLALSNSVPRDRLILGKAIGNYISLLFPLLIPLVLSLIFLMLAPNLSLGSSDWMRLFLILLMFFIYLSVFFSLGLFVSARSMRSSTSFLVLLIIWVVFVMVIPKLSVALASQLKSVPSVHEISTRKTAFRAQVNKETMNWLRDAMRGSDPKTFGKKMEERLNEQARVIEANNNAIERDYQLKKKAQQNLAVNLSRISPASALTFGSMSLARTGVDDYDQFLESIRKYRFEFEKWYNAKAFGNARATTGGRTKLSLADMPAFSANPESLRESLFRAAPDFALMFAMIIVFFAGAYVSFLRYDIR
jgi:ABC-type transport system involved in multi-copper enzyme maturation permease subunit